MTRDEANAINNRLDGVDRKLDRLLESVAAQVAVCKPSRERLDIVCGTVYGNGHKGLVSRVVRLETVGGLRSKGFWALVALVSAVASGAIVAAVKVGLMLMYQ